MAPEINNNDFIQYFLAADICLSYQTKWLIMLLLVSIISSITTN